MAADSSSFAWRVPWTEAVAGDNPRIHTELDTTEQLTLLEAEHWFKSFIRSNSMNSHKNSYYSHFIDEETEAHFKQEYIGSGYITFLARQSDT